MGEIKAIETVYNGYRFRSRLEARWAVFFDALGVEYEYEPEGFKLPSGKCYLPDFRVKCHGTRGGFNNSIMPCEHCIHRKSDIENCCTQSPWSNFCELFSSLECCNNNRDYPEWITTRNRGAGEVIACERCEPDWPFDLYIEVKGKMTQEDADKIHEFCRTIRTEKHDEYTIQWYEVHHPVLVVGNIPNPDRYYDDLHNYDKMNGIDIYPWNYETIDGDYFAAYPAVKDGCFYLDGDDSNYMTMNPDVISRAFEKARQAQFEYGKTPTGRRY